MAPLTRRGASAVKYSRPVPAQRSPEDSWNLVVHPEDDPSGEFEDEARESLSSGSEEQEEFSDARNTKMSSSPNAPRNRHRESLQSLGASGDQLGREIEDFAECLDRLHSRKNQSKATLYENAFKLVRSYQTIAQNTVKRLRREHDQKPEKQLRKCWRRRVKEMSEGVLEEDDIDDEEDEQDDADQDNTPLSSFTMGYLKRWEQEAQTWDLLALMLDLEFAKPGLHRKKDNANKIRASGEINRHASEEKIWDQFLMENRLAKERFTVLSWLKRNAESSGKDIDIIVKQLEEGAERGNGLWALGWLHTKEAVKGQKRLRSSQDVLDPSSPVTGGMRLNSTENAQLVTQLDPDAVTRQGRALEYQDEYFERAIWLASWEMLRRGKSWTEVREWCRERLEGWRSVSVRGSVAAWDKLIDGRSEESSQAMAFPSHEDGSPETVVTGTRSRALWRRMCFALARRGGVDDYERAVYGILSGDLQSVQKVCRTWDDFMFAHYNSLVLGQFDEYLEKHYPDRIPPLAKRNYGLFHSVQFHGDPKDVSQRLIQSLKVNPITNEEAKEPLKKIQGSLIAGIFPQFLTRQGIAISKFANDGQRSQIIPRIKDPSGTNGPSSGVSAKEYIGYDDIDALRVMVHALLLHQQLGSIAEDSPNLVAIENVVVAYIDLLTSIDKLDLVPLYASRLSKLRSELTLGRVMLGVTNHAERGRMVKLMRGLDVAVEEVVKTQMGLLLSDLSREEEDESVSREIQILEDSNGPGQMKKEIKQSFIGDEPSQVEDLLISSLEWFLAVDGMWYETFYTGTKLYKRFLLRGRLAAVLELLRRAPTSRISKEKSEYILGRKIDITADFDDPEYDPDVEADLGNEGGSSSPFNQFRKMREVLTKQAKSYMELEKLAIALNALQTWRLLVDENIQDRVERKKHLQEACHNVVDAMTPLLNGWLVSHSTDEEKSDFDIIRSMYLPEVILAYNSVLHYTGSVLDRDVSTECLELCTIVGAESSDILGCFAQSKQLPELVEAFARSSKAIVKANTAKGVKTSEEKRRAGSGEILAIWQVKPFPEISAFYGW